MSHTSPSPTFVDFLHLKQAVKIDSVFALLGLPLKQAAEQWRGACPACKSGGDRTLVVTPNKAAFYCFAAKQGGDVIALVAHIKAIGMKEAAAFLAEGSAPPAKTPASEPTLPVTAPEKEKAGFNPLTYLQPEHPAVQGLGVSAETAVSFGVGFASKGMMRGRVAIPIYNQAGQLVAYCGKSIGNLNPEFLYPDSLHRTDYIYNLQLVKEGAPLLLAPNPLAALLLVQAGFENVVAFLTETIERFQLKVLIELMEKKNCKTISMF